MTTACWDESLAAMTANVRKAVREMRREGVVSMSRGNFRQVVSTRGVSVPVGEFDRLLSEAIRAARVSSYVQG